MTAIELLDASINIIKGSFPSGFIVAPPQQDYLLKAIGGVANLVKNGQIKSGEEKEKLKLLAQNLKELDSKTKPQLANMQSFLVDNEFGVEIIGNMFKMKKYMIECLDNEISAEKFQDAYDNNTPLDLTYVLISLLSQRTTNPLMMVMEKEQVKTRATFEKWENIIRAIMGELLLLEAFATGFLKNNSDNYDYDIIWEHKDQIFMALDMWRDEYKFVSYWDEMKIFMKEYIPASSNLTHSQKAEGIKKKLESYKTSDAFYIFVFNECQMNHGITYYCPNDTNQIIGCWNVGKCNAFIYRSRTANQKNEADFKKIQDEVNSCMKNKLSYTGVTLDNILKNQLVNRGILNGCGFICLIDPKHNLTVASVNCIPNKPGPGGNATVEVIKGLLLMLSFHTFTMYASFD